MSVVEPDAVGYVSWTDASEAVKDAYRYASTGNGFTGPLMWLRDRVVLAPLHAANPPGDQRQEGEVPTRFIDGMGWVVACRDAVRFVAALASPTGVDEARDARRYRHMRATHRPGPYDKHRLEWYLPRRTRMTAEGLDEAIDAELAALAARDGGSNA